MTLRVDFYNAAAQLIPLLVVAAAVDARIWANQDKRRPSEITSELITFVMVTLAWVVSLYVVATGENHPLAGVLVALGLAVGWTEIVGSLALHRLGRLGHAIPTRRQRAWVMALVFMPIGAVMLLSLTVL